MKLPLEFITFAFVDAKMYHHAHKKGTFLLPSTTKRTWGNSVAYGGIFVLRDFDFYIRILDAYHMCSMTTLLKNHTHDIHHRIKTEATPISFSTIDDFIRIKYEEREPIMLHAYYGNITHPIISRRLKAIRHSNRIQSGVHPYEFQQLLKEVMPI